MYIWAKCLLKVVILNYIIIWGWITFSTITSII